MPGRRVPRPGKPLRIPATTPLTHARKPPRAGETHGIAIARTESMNASSLLSAILFAAFLSTACSGASTPVAPSRIDDAGSDAGGDFDAATADLDAAAKLDGSPARDAETSDASVQGDGGRLCAPDTYAFCRCPDTTPGTKLCNSEGDAFGPCMLSATEPCP